MLFRQGWRKFQKLCLWNNSDWHQFTYLLLHHSWQKFWKLSFWKTSHWNQFNTSLIYHGQWKLTKCLSETTWIGSNVHIHSFTMIEENFKSCVCEATHRLASIYQFALLPYLRKIFKFVFVKRHRLGPSYLFILST